MHLIRKSGSLVKLNLRLAPEKLKAADALRQNWGGLCRLVRLIRGKSCQRPQQVGQDFPRGVLARDNQSGNGGARDA
jgi:hypothetical protein